LRKRACESLAGDRDLKQILWRHQRSETILDGLYRDEEMIEPVSAGHDGIVDVCSFKPRLSVLGAGHRFDQLVACDIGRLSERLARQQSWRSQDSHVLAKQEYTFA